MRDRKSKAASRAAKTDKQTNAKRSAVPSVPGTAKRRSTKTKEQKGQPTDEVNQPTSEIAADLIWNEDGHAIDNYAALGQCLAQSPDLFRKPEYGSGLLLCLPGGTYHIVARGADLFPIVVDRIRVRVIKDGKTKGTSISTSHLNAMLRSESFLGQFRPMDAVTRIPLYLSDFTLSRPGYNDGGPGYRVFYEGGEPAISTSLDATNRILDVLAFETNADRTNAAAALITVMLGNHWLGCKPILLATGTKSGCGKDTTIALAAGLRGSVSMSYQSTDWALERQFTGIVKTRPDAGVLVFENARLTSRDRHIASSFIERIVEDKEPVLFSTGTGTPFRRRNDFVVAISTNYGSVSEDIFNRCLPIRLAPVGSLNAQTSPIGNPKNEYLPAHREQIAAEVRGMIERWKAVGMPRDEKVRHRFSDWAATVGGILLVNEFTDFLGNYVHRKSQDDPIRRSLSLMAVARPDQWLTPEEMVAVASELGIVKTVVPAADQDSVAGRTRGIGVVLSSHREEELVTETDTHAVTFRLEKKRGRWEKPSPHVRYRFVKVSESLLPENRV